MICAGTFLTMSRYFYQVELCLTHIGCEKCLGSMWPLRASYRVAMPLVFVIVAVLLMAGSSSVSADIQNGYQIPYQNWNCYPNSYYCNYPGYPPYPGYFNGNYYTTCQSSNDNTVQCFGYLYQDPSGCVELAITVSSAYGLLSNQYYTLHNLPSSYTIGAWATVTGQLYQGYNYAPNGAACPGNYINVTSISQ